HPRLLADEKVRVPVAFAELDLDVVLKGQPRPQKFKSLSRLQPVERDFAFVMESSQVVGDLLKEAKKAGGSAISSLNVFDIYEGDKLPQGQKSVALRVQFQGQNEALTEAELQQLSQKIVEAAQKSVKAQLR
ncbi:MAG: phenylalanine--tRNA ligase subunit beta, partial [Bdellovibrionaceae bacterium]|nr:phenylalanine--tRNA ligase subunit beta [Pseudobdellovibrionaceae bacterium]